MPKALIEKTGAVKYPQVVRQLKTSIAAGALQPGDRLPSFAQMRAQFGLAQNTVNRVFSVLEQDGLIVREPGRGVFVAQKQERKAVGAIAVSNGFPARHPYYVHLLQGVQEEAHRQHMEVLLPHPDSRIAWQNVDGVLICSPDEGDFVRRLPPGMPRVSLMHAGENSISVLADDAGGTRAATEHLLSLGHRRIGFLAMPLSSRSDLVTRRRWQGYRAAMKKAGVKVLPNWTYPIIRPGEPSGEWKTFGREKMRQWLQQAWSTPGERTRGGKALTCTALVAHNDEAAVGAIEALQEAGLRVPSDVSVVGFDGTEAADYFRPRLSTIEVPLHEIGARGAAHLIRQIKKPLNAPDEPATPCAHVLPTRLKIGDSTAPVAF